MPTLPDLSLVVERRAAEATAPPERVGARTGPALTAREERVRRLLMRELDGMNRRFKVEKTWAGKQEREGLARLDVAYLDAQIGKMRRLLEHPWRLRAAFFLLPAVLVVFLLGESMAGLDYSSAWGLWLRLGALAFNLAFGSWAYGQATQALRRKLYIYEALRALSDADETDVILSRATEQADALIARIVAAELAAEKHRPGLTLTSFDSPEEPTSRPRAQVH